MNELTFDSLTRTLTGATPRRGLLQLLLGLGLGGTLGLDRLGTVRAKKCGPCEKRRKNGQCKKRRDGTRCGNNRSCQNGRCRRCRDQGVPCQEDIQCCSGICDRYFGACSDVRMACNPNKAGQCGDGLCCPEPDFPGGGQCFDTLNNSDLCGTDCDHLENCFDITGEATCQNGKCCCLDKACTRPNGDPVPPCKA